MRKGTEVRNNSRVYRSVNSSDRLQVRGWRLKELQESLNVRPQNWTKCDLQRESAKLGCETEPDSGRITLASIVRID